MTSPTPSFDLYDDLVSFDHLTEEAGKLVKAESEITTLNHRIECITKQKSDLVEKNLLLRKNISKLYKTAKKEIEGKNAEIKEAKEKIQELERRERAGRSTSRYTDRRRHSSRRSSPCRNNKRTPTKSRSPKRLRERSISPKYDSRDRRKSSRSNRHRLSPSASDIRRKSKELSKHPINDKKKTINKKKSSEPLESGEINEDNTCVSQNDKTKETVEKSKKIPKKPTDKITNNKDIQSGNIGIIDDKNSPIMDEKLSKKIDESSKTSKKENKQDNRKIKRASLESTPLVTPLKERNVKNHSPTDKNIPRSRTTSRDKYNDILKNESENIAKSINEQEKLPFKEENNKLANGSKSNVSASIENTFVDRADARKQNLKESCQSDDERKTLHSHLLKYTGLDKKELDAKMEEISQRNQKIIKEQEDNCIISDYKKAMHAVRTMDKKTRKRKRKSSDFSKLDDQEQIEEQINIVSIPSVQSINSLNSSCSTQITSVDNIIELARKQTKANQDKLNCQDELKTLDNNYYLIPINLPPWSRVEVPKLPELRLRPHAVNIPENKIAEVDDPRIIRYRLKSSLSASLLKKDESLRICWGSEVTHFDYIKDTFEASQHSEMDISKISFNSSKKSLSISTGEEFDGKTW